MSGAAILTSLSALKVGAGLVRLGIPVSLNPIVETKATEVITVPLPETKEGTIGIEALKKIETEIERAQVVIIGPGLSTHLETQQLLHKLVPNINVPLVIDADGINNLDTKILKKIKASTIITPHPGEFSRIIGLTIPEIQEKRIEITNKFANELGLTILLKGAPTIISSDGFTFLLPIYNSALAKAGSGDVLTGVIGGLLAQKLSLIDAAKTGAYLHGKAGEIASKRLTKYAPLASDIMELLPEVIKEIKEVKT
jgi:NAD(P)H-hydrate epimerase